LASLCMQIVALKIEWAAPFYGTLDFLNYRRP